MEFNGIVMFKVADKANLLDLRFEFLATQSTQNLAIYSFDNDSSAEEQAYADAAVRARAERKKPKMRIDILGERSSSPLNQRMSQDFNKLASSNGDKAVAKVSKFVPAGKGGGSGSFTVNLEIQTSKKSKVVVDVPFDGDPGSLAEQSFHGRASLFAHSKEKNVDIPGLINTILDVKP